MASIHAVLLCPTPVRSAEYKDGVSLTMVKNLIEHQRATQAESLRRKKMQVFSICLSCGYCRGMLELEILVMANWVDVSRPAT